MTPRRKTQRRKALFPERLSEKERAELFGEEMAPEVSEAEMEAFGQSRVKVRLSELKTARANWSRIE